MTKNQRIAYEWAKKTDFHSVAADYARELAGLVDELTEANQHNLNCYMQDHEELEAAKADMKQHTKCFICKNLPSSGKMTDCDKYGRCGLGYIHF